MPENRDDRMTLTLDALRTDVERTPLADSLSRARRGDQRTRRQAVGARSPSWPWSPARPASTAAWTATTAPTQIPASPSPSAEQTLDLAAEPFLTADDLTGRQLRPGRTVHRRRPGAGLLPSSAPRDPGMGAAQVRSTRFYQDGSEAEIREYVLRFADTADRAEQAALKRAYADLVARPAPPTVDPSEGTLTTRDSVRRARARRRVRSSRYFARVASEPTTTRSRPPTGANVVVVLEWQASATDRRRRRAGSGPPTGCRPPSTAPSADQIGYAGQREAHDLAHQAGGLGRRLADLDAGGLEGLLLGLRRCRTSRRRSRRRGPSSCPRAR